MKTARHEKSVRLWWIRAACLMAASLAFLAGCNKLRPTNMIPLDSAGMHSESIDQLRKYQINDAEVQQILIAGRAGMSEQGCVELIGIARSRHRVFAEGDFVGGLLDAGMKEPSVLELVRVDQLSPFAGEAQAMRLAGLSDEVVVEVARRRARGQTVVGGPRLAELRDAGFSNAELVAALDRGMTDKEAMEVLARHNYAMGGHGFVRQYGRRR